MTRLLYLLTPIALCSSAALAQEAVEKTELQCTTQDRNEMVLILLCPDTLDAQQMAEEGRAACGGQLPCGAWIWTAEGDLPTETPPSHDMLPPDAIAAARAIWVDEDEQLILLAKESR